MTPAPPGDLYPTDVYTLEYDGFADFPRYPLNPLADDGRQPDMTVLVNLGYGQIQHGWDTGFANVPTGFGLLRDQGPAKSG